MSENKKLIFNSDDFGHSHPFNLGVFKGLKTGILTTACVLPNLEGYMEAVSLKSDLKNINFGVHLNLIEGKSITTSMLLTDLNGKFNNSYIDILRKSYDKSFMEAVEFEFRTQIERVLSDFEVDHINSHMHIHSIPNLFKLVCNLALEYKIPYVRTQFEKPYFAKPIKPINLVKLGLLNFLTKKNKISMPKNILTNDYLLGVTYTSHMDKNTVLAGLKAINSGVVEILIHPAFYENTPEKPNNYKEFLLTQDENLETEIKAMGFKLCSCSLKEALVNA